MMTATTAVMTTTAATAPVVTTATAAAIAATTTGVPLAAITLRRSERRTDLSEYLIHRIRRALQA